jgi:acetolactate synthase-1/2/3 large subunit
MSTGDADSALVSGGSAVVQALVAAGVDHAFCVPGESFLGVLDALYDEPRIRLVTTRHEGGAAFMAEAYAKLSHKPAVCMGTRMVGAGNLAIGVHTARQDSTPMIALVGQVSARNRHREAFQETELTHVFSPIAKWVVEPPSADRLAELTLRAAWIARSGRPGPVVISLREDLLDQVVARPALQAFHVPRPAPDPAVVKTALDILRAARRPLLLLGGGVLASRATDASVAFAELEQVPVVAAWRRPDVFPNDHPLYIGHTGYGAPPSVWDRLADADVLLVVGARLDEITTQEFRHPGHGTSLMHVDSDDEGLGGTRIADLACVSDAALFFDAILAAGRASPQADADLDDRRGQIARLRAAWEDQTTPARGRSRKYRVDQQAVVAHLRESLPADAILTTDAGNFSGWAARYYRWARPGTFLGPTSGAMGYGLPAAIGARLAAPDKPVVALIGDGGFLMTGTELETAVREEVKIVAVVHDNRQYGTIRMHQMQQKPGRQIATALGPVDVAGFARSLGAIGFTVDDDCEFPGVLADAMAADGPAVIHLQLDSEQIAVGSDEAAR